MHWTLCWTLAGDTGSNKMSSFSRGLRSNRENRGHGTVCVCAQSLSCIWLFVIPRTVAHQAPLSMEKSTLNIRWKDWYWSCNTLATWFKEPSRGNRPWWWKRLKAEGEGTDRGWEGWMASLTQWTWVWEDSGRCWRTGNNEAQGKQMIDSEVKGLVLGVPPSYGPLNKESVEIKTVFTPQTCWVEFLGLKPHVTHMLLIS